MKYQQVTLFICFSCFLTQIFCLFSKGLLFLFSGLFMMSVRAGVMFYVIKPDKGQDSPCNQPWDFRGSQWAGVFLPVYDCFMLFCIVWKNLSWIKSRQPSIILKKLLDVIIFRYPAWVCQSSTCIISLDLSFPVSRPPLSHIAKILTLVWLIFEVSQTFTAQILKFQTFLYLFVLLFSRTRSHKVVLSTYTFGFTYF